ncbi:hypothetical protein THRCLA_11817 [Thraustotheca clavata]|uniref:Uncharacterized protein n=1 Tax=Thraustotheca clavata TaxID=74557 RepID=A0A1V9Y6J7_9STRA|nr:hypothetical protein THRCLA_11817 [Thraustotheca clavata]
MPTTSNSHSRLTTSIETSLPFVLTFKDGFNRAMAIYDEVKHLVCLISHHKLKKRYLSGHTWHSRLTWTTNCSDKSMFRIVSRDHLQGPLQVEDQLCLQSIKWPNFYVSFSSGPSTHSLGSLNLKRHIKNAVPLTAANAIHREYSLSYLRHTSNTNESVPTVYISEECYTTVLDAEGDSDIEEPVYVLTPLSTEDQPSSNTYSGRLREHEEAEMAYRADWRESLTPSCSA